MSQSKVTRYTHWVDRHRRWILLGSVVIAALGGFLASSLPVHSDFSNLLPPSRQSVRDLEVLKHRARSFGTIFVLVDARSPEAATRATDLLRTELGALDSADVSEVVESDRATRDFFWTHRFLYAPLEDIEKAHDAVAEKIRIAKLESNPLFIDLDEADEALDEADEALDEADEAPASDPPQADGRDELVKKLDEAEAKLQGSDAHVAKDGKVRLFVLRTTKPSTDFGLGQRVMNRLDESIERIEAQVDGVDIGVTGNVAAAYYEKQSVMKGIATAAIITAILIALVLLFYFRSVLAVGASLWSLTVAVCATFGITYLTIGHLNVLTAFLVAIVAGNGINAGLMLLSRYFEEVRDGHADNEGLARAIAGAAHGTLAASLAAGVAYGALIATDFRGFRHFGIIGSVGMVLCWVSAFTILPAGLCELRYRRRIAARKEPALSRWIAALHPRRPGLVTITGLLLLTAATVWTARYVASDPLETDWRNLRSDSEKILETRRLDVRMRETVGRDFGAGLTSRFVVAVQDRADTEKVAAILRAAPADLLQSVTTLEDLLPKDQPRKLELLARLRAMVEDDAVLALAEEDRSTLDRIRPPSELRALSLEDLPRELTEHFVEQDGSTGKLILVSGAARFKTWNVHDRVEMAEGVRALGLPDSAVIGGQSFVIADIIESMAEDGVRSSIIAIVGALLVIVILVGTGRHGLITILAGVTGIVGMIALCDLVGLKVNFLDLVALPITIGIGIDYSVNLAIRDRQEPDASVAHVLGSTGGAVMLCSLTTIVGYGSLLLSENAGIRSFGLAAILGEGACIAAALILVPALLAWFRERGAASRSESGHHAVKARES